MPGGYIVLTLAFKPEGRRWVARCEELGTATFGRSLTEAEKRIKEAVLLHLSTLEDVGECTRFLMEHKVEFHRIKPRETIKITKLVCLLADKIKPAIAKFQINYLRFGIY